MLKTVENGNEQVSIILKNGNPKVEGTLYLMKPSANNEEIFICTNNVRNYGDTIKIGTFAPGTHREFTDDAFTLFVPRLILLFEPEYQITKNVSLFISIRLEIDVFNAVKLKTKSLLLNYGIGPACGVKFNI